MPAGPSQNQNQWLASMILSALISGTIVAGGFNLSFLRSHPWESIGIIFLLLILVAIYSIATGLFGKLRDPIINWLSKQILGEDGRFEREYLKSVASSVRTFETKGIPYDDMGSLSMAKLFVDPGVAERDSTDRQGLLPDIAAPGSARGTLDGLIENDGTDRIIAVIGVPGSGKTTLLRHAAARACDQSRPRLKRPGHSARLPILLYLRDHVATLAADPRIPITDLETPLLRAKPALKDWLNGKLNAGRCLVLLDGLDEVAQPEDRARVAAWVQGLTTTFSGCRFVISSRPGGYQGNPIDGAKEFRVCGFTSDQVRVFLRRWYGEPETLGTASGPASSTASGTAAAATSGEADQLWHLLQTRPAIYDLAANPLLLTMIAAVHGQKGTLPDNRAALYQDIGSVVLWTRAQAKGQKFPLNEKQKTAVLAEIAYAMMSRQRSDLSTHDVEAIIEPLLSRMGDVISSAAFLTQANSDGLLGEREAGYHGFAHKTFQEYLAAVHIRDARPNTATTNDLVGDLTKTVSDQWWTETSIFYAAIASADRLVTACLNAQTTTALALACECADVAHELSTDLRAEVDKLLTDATNLDDLASRRPAEIEELAGVLLARHLRQRVQTSMGTQVCALPIPADIYQMFLAATRAPAPDAPASQLPASTGEESHGNKKARDKKAVPPAVGMRDTDAAEFCRWVYDVPDRQVSYRLPHPAELDELGRQQRIQVLPAGSLPRVWTESPGHVIYPHRLPPAADQQATSIDLADVVKRELADPGFFLGQHMVYARVWVKTLVDSLSATFARTFALAPILTAGSGFDVALNNAVESALERDLSRAVNLASELDRLLHFNFDYARDAARVRADDIMGDIFARDVSLARRRSHDRSVSASDASPACDLALLLSDDLARTLDHHLRTTIARDRDPTSAVSLARVFGRVFVLAGALADVLASFHGRDFGIDPPDLVLVFLLARALDHALARASAGATALERSASLNLAAVAGPVLLGSEVRVPIEQFNSAVIRRGAQESLGTALAGALSKVPAKSSTFQQRATLFAEAFCSISSVPSHWLLPEDHLVRDTLRKRWLPEARSLNENRLNATTTALLTAVARQPGDRPVAWVKAFSNHLVTTAAPVFNRKERCTPEKAFAIRLAALCLAAEADRLASETEMPGTRRIGDEFRDIAAGITWLEQRHSGQILANEVIMLAVE